MNPLFCRALLAVPVFFLMPVAGQADEAKLSPERLDLLDERGYFTPAFKTAVHDYIDTKQALEQVGIDQKKLSEQLPGLQKQRDDAEAQTDALRKELDVYQHPEVLDFTTLQDRMKDPAAKSEDLLALAQAFLWTYPTDPHADEARQDLQQIQKKLADQQQAAQDAQAAQAAAQAKLLQRVQNRDLSLNEWKDFLRDKSQEDILKYLGRPDIAQTEYWIYKSAYTVDPDTGQKVGLEIDYNGTRVNSVTAGPVAP
jgi:predicted ribosome quality control (RQC) complex YloA/Tae2 family protein